MDQHSTVNSLIPVAVLGKSILYLNISSRNIQRIKHLEFKIDRFKFLIQIENRLFKKRKIILYIIICMDY